MLSEKQLEANRANAQKSTGPKTPEGKRQSCLNAIRHGFTGQTVVLPGEDLEAFNNFVRDLVQAMAPVGALELQLAQSYAGFQWRINRAAAIEETMLTLGVIEEIAKNLIIEHPEAHNAASNAKTFRDDMPTFDRVSMYSQRMVNQAERTIHRLKLLQAERKQAEQTALAEAASIYQLHAMKNQLFDPRENGFDLNIDSIKAFIRRNTFNIEAKLAAKLGWELTRFEEVITRAAA